MVQLVGAKFSIGDTAWKCVGHVRGHNDIDWQATPVRVRMIQITDLCVSYGRYGNMNDGQTLFKRKEEAELQCQLHQAEDQALVESGGTLCGRCPQ